MIGLEKLLVWSTLIFVVYSSSFIDKDKERSFKRKKFVLKFEILFF